MRCKINNCVKVLIFFIISILQCEAFDTTENPVITLEYGKDTNNINTYYVEQNKSLQIIFKNSHAGHVRCYNFIRNPVITFIDKDFPNYDKDSVINITSVTPDMSTEWSCITVQKYHGGARIVSEYYIADLFYNFNLHVKGARSVSVSINGDSLNFTKTGLNVQHDGETFFSFIDHQNIELVCAHVDKQFAVSLEYFNQNGEKIFEIPPTGDTSLLFRTRLTSKQDKFYIDCIGHTYNNFLEYRYRTYFYKQELNNNPDKQDNTLIVTVNGLLERYVRRTGSYFDYPIFKYVDGEMIIVTCEAKRPYSSIPLQFYFPSNQVTLYNRIKVKKIDDKIVATINYPSTIFLNKIILFCGFNSRSEKEEYARITFKSDVAVGTVRVFGLARPNILYQYHSGDVWTTIYQYSVNETISLGCVLIMPPENFTFKWNFNGEESSRNGYRLSGTKNYYADKNFIKTLTEQDDKKIIKCIVYENYKIFNFAEIRLQLKEISNSENFEDQINPHTSNNLIIIFACIPGLVLTITVVGIVYWRKRTQRPNNTCNTEAPCNGVKEDNEMTPIPESMYDSCPSENSTIQPNNDVPKSPDCSDPNYQHYEKVNYLQCKPKSSEPQQRSSKMYNVAYDHFRSCVSGK